ncbi:site-specific integrase [Halopseudomonas bauzanensis]|nr:site-specific integrase [Halopseudomonas bauzanensis]
MPDAVAEEIVNYALEELMICKVLAELYRVELRYPPPSYAYNVRVCETKKVLERLGWWSEGRKGHIRKTLEVRLQSAAYCLIALFTGMRAHEVLRIKYGLRNNWSEEYVEIDGGVKKMCFVLSETTKLEARPASYKWQAVPVVKLALMALEIGFKRYYDTGNPWLFPSRKDGVFGGKQALTKNALGHNIKTFCKIHDIRSKGIVWNLATHQFRKKFARTMVRQGLGIKALQDQLKHYDIEMTKIYGDPNLYVELQAEKFELSAELLEEFVGSQIPVIGGGAEELNAMRREFLGLTKKDRTLFLQSLPSKALVEQTDDGLCFYRANKALCGGDKSNCRPGDCNNAWMPAAGKKRTLLWRKTENDRMMGFFKSQPLKVHFLKSRNEEIQKLLGQLEKLGACE